MGRLGVRLLPLTVVAMGVVVVCKLGTLSLALAPLLASASLAVLPAAQAAGPSSGASSGATPGASVPASANASAAKQGAASGGADVKPQAGMEAATPYAEGGGPLQAEARRPAEPAAGPSAAELAVLQDLRARRAALEERVRVVEAREAVLAAAERRLGERVAELSSMQVRLETMEEARRERDEANWRGLVKTYETMRPASAAAIFNDMEPTVLVQVLDRMKEGKSSAVLAAMAPERARSATAQLVQWRTRSAGGPRG